jgi:hypothetical protein
LERKLDLPNWTPEKIAALGQTHISRWAAAHAVSMDRGYASEEREGGTPALDESIPSLSRDQLSVFSLQEWEQEKSRLVYESWVAAARRSIP